VRARCRAQPGRDAAPRRQPARRAGQTASVSEAADLSKLKSSVFFHGAIAGGVIVASLVLVPFLAWRWLDSAWSTLDVTEASVQMRTLNEYLETRTIPAGAWASVEVRDSDCSLSVATVEISRRDRTVAPGERPERIDGASFVVYVDSGDPIAEERPGMSAEQVEAELCG